MSEVHLTGELFGLFLAEYQHHPGTYRAYRADLEALLNALGWEREIESIRADELNKYIGRLRGVRAKYRDHPTRPTVKEKLSESTVNGHIKTIKRWFKWMVDEEYLEVSPARKLKQTKLPREISREKAMQDEEYERVLLYARTHGERDYALLLFIADSGCRAAGAAGLTLDHLYLDRGLALVTEKGQKSRYVPFGEEAAIALRAWLAARPRVKHHFVFTAIYPPHSSMTPAAVSQVIRRACKKLGLRSLGSHSLRHRKGHQLAAAGVAITSAADLLGHDSIESTKGYYQQSWDEIMNIGRQLATPRQTEDDQE